MDNFYIRRIIVKITIISISLFLFIAAASSIEAQTECSGNIYSDAASAEACVKLAEQQGGERGYDINCAAEKVGHPFVNPSTGLNYYYNPACVVNGSAGHGAALLAGYSGGGTGLGGGTLLSVNSGWDILKTELKSEAAASRCGAGNWGYSPERGYYCVSSGGALPAGTYPPSSGAPTAITPQAVNNIISQINSLISGLNTMSVASASEAIGRIQQSLQAMGITPTGQATGTTTIGNAQTSSTAFPRTVRTNTGALNARIAPNTTAQLAARSYNEQTFIAIGAVCGENVQGEARWWVTHQNTYVWSGGTKEKPELNCEGAPGGGGQQQFPLASTPTAAIPSTFRYLKIETTEPGWVSWREIEAYDEAGNKVAPVAAAASSDWRAPHPHNAIGPSGVYDGKDWTVWNAGETNPACIGGYNPSCPTSSRSAWIQLDYGSPKQIAKIRLLETGDQYPETDKFYISNDNVSYSYVGQFSGAIRDNTWIEYPFPTSTATTTASLTANGKHELEVSYGEGLTLDWSSTNGMGAFSTYSHQFDQNLPGYTYGNRTTSCVIMETALLDPFYRLKNGTLPLQGTYRAFIADFMCQPKEVFTITYKATNQYDPTKFAQDSVTIKVVGLPKDFTTNGGILYNWENNERNITVGRGGSKTVKIITFGTSYKPTLTALNLPLGISVSFGAWDNTEYYPRAPVTVSV
ncbi:MAG: hypothetical protein AAB686_01750, partial [Patescibacteria group bacterium]